MSAQVDVLAVMDALIALMYEGPIGVHGANEARDAVAALIAERDALREEVAALRQQPAPVDLEQFREAVRFYMAQNELKADDAMRRGHNRDVVESHESRGKQGQRLLSIIDNAGKVECATCGGRGEVGGHTGQTPEQFDYVTEPCPECATQPAPVVDDAMVSAMVNRAVAATAHPRTTCLDHYEYAEAVIVAALARAQGVQS